MEWTAGAWPGAPGPGEAHVWKTGLDVDCASFDAALMLLSADERVRAARFRFERDRNRFVAGRAFLRTLLGHYLDAAPGELVFATNEFGKPSIAGAGIRFNLSHSHGLALAAFTIGREVGVDVEQIRESVTRDRIAERFFSPSEAAALTALPEAARTAAFFRCWTLKEAWIKAVGRGLSIPLDSFDVTFDGDAPRVAASRPDAAEAARWTLVQLDPQAGFVGALAVEGPCRLRLISATPSFPPTCPGAGGCPENTNS